jgi:hypothetical protein
MNVIQVLIPGSDCIYQPDHDQYWQAIVQEKPELGIRVLLDVLWFAVHEETYGAGDGIRTRVIGLEGRRPTAGRRPLNLNLVHGAGFEPATARLSTECSTN